jgi:hypothetical protein
MAYREPANREYELELFDRMIAGQTDECILLLEAEGKMGKSMLLSAFERCCLPNVPCAAINLKGSSTGLHEVFYRLCDALGWDRFPAFRACVESLRQVTIDKNVIIGRADIEVALRAPDEGDRAARRAQLTQAFFDDLRAWSGCLVLIFDTYEQANPEVQDWLAGPCLARARRTADLVVVIAGRQVPEESIEWAAYCHRHRLGGIEDVDAWHLYSQRRKLPVPRDWIEGYCVASQGHPGQVDELLAGAARWGGTR